MACDSRKKGLVREREGESDERFLIMNTVWQFSLSGVSVRSHNPGEGLLERAEKSLVIMRKLGTNSELWEPNSDFRSLAEC